jgi:hypothetical protein
MSPILPLLTSSRRQSQDSDDQDGVDPLAYVWPVKATLRFFGTLGVIFLLLYSLYGASASGLEFGHSAARFFGLVGVLGLIAFASFASGGLLGFLFGVPKSISGEARPAAILASDRMRKDDKVRQVLNAAVDGDVLPEEIESEVEVARYRSNTNLEEMSDWLTKLIVGAGLVQAREIGDAFQELVRGIGRQLQDAPFAHAAIGANILGFMVLGFFTLYLLTRLYLATAFDQVEGILRTVGRGLLRKKARLQSLVNLDLSNLSAREKELLRKIITAHRVGQVHKLSSDFVRGSEEHQALRSLKDRGLIDVKEGRSFRPDRTVTLTPIAEAILPRIEQNLAS